MLPKMDISYCIAPSRGGQTTSREITKAIGNKMKENERDLTTRHNKQSKQKAAGEIPTSKRQKGHQPWHCQ